MLRVMARLDLTGIDKALVKLRGCATLAGIETTILAEETCRTLMRRAKFDPALDVYGKARPRLLGVQDGVAYRMRMGLLPSTGRSVRYRQHSYLSGSPIR